MTPEPKPEEVDTREPNKKDDPEAGKGGIFEGWKKGEKDKTEPAKKRGRPPTSQSLSLLRRQLEQNFMMLGMGLMLINEYDGKVVVKNAPEMSAALIGIAETSPKVKRILQGMMKTGTFAQFAMAFAPVVVPIAANHGVVPVEVAMMFTDDLPPLEGKAKRAPE